MRIDNGDSTRAKGSVLRKAPGTSGRSAAAGRRPKGSGNGSENPRKGSGREMEGQGKAVKKAVEGQGKAVEGSRKGSKTAKDRQKKERATSAGPALLL